MKIYFISNNEYKRKEIQKYYNIFKNEDSKKVKKIKVICLDNGDNSNEKELQTDDVESLVEDKVLKAFKKYKLPVFVEHTVLLIDNLGMLPGTITQQIWSSMANVDKKNHEPIGSLFCRCFSKETAVTAKVQTCMGFCDGKKVYKLYKSECEGFVVASPEGESEFQWDVVFRPKGSSKTFAQMNFSEKSIFSPRKKAFIDMMNDICYNADIEGESIQNTSNGTIIEELRNKIKNGDVMLFAGAGVSANIDIDNNRLPQWSDLIKNLAKQNGYSYDVISQYGDALQLAEFFFTKKSDDAINEDISVALGICDKSACRKAVHESKIYQLIKELKFPIIYTTNYDPLLEYMYEDDEYTAIKKLSDFGKISNDKVQIIKYHGDLDNPDTIVLSERSYFDRIDLQNHLDIKFRTDIMTKSILFLGYSLSDINVRLIIYKLNKLRQELKVPTDAYIYMSSPNVVQKEIFESWGIKVVTGDEPDKEKGLRTFLERLQ